MDQTVQAKRFHIEKEVVTPKEQSDYYITRKVWAFDGTPQVLDRYSLKVTGGPTGRNGLYLGSGSRIFEHTSHNSSIEMPDTGSHWVVGSTGFFRSAARFTTGPRTVLLQNATPLSLTVNGAQRWYSLEFTEVTWEVQASYEFNPLTAPIEVFAGRGGLFSQVLDFVRSIFTWSLGADVIQKVPFPMHSAGALVFEDLGNGITIEGHSMNPRGTKAASRFHAKTLIMTSAFQIYLGGLKFWDGFLALPQASRRELVSMAQRYTRGESSDTRFINTHRWIRWAYQYHNAFDAPPVDPRTRPYPGYRYRQASGAAPVGW